ncbi:hypothetical protein F8M41_022972 [Gigaspora margarita]|uniref:Uncharacterized protein n=1 Tax=Gigaspora margarita TaxID=4874 RepID=A0A8H3WY25_GIGMA|nr:hypothetical protein F8M41_013660 [Gigaspora margarita]KAF0484558.1 hypothetical protein F8M41_022972 [Gigaspora margarita]
MARVFDNMDASRSVKKSGLKTDRAKLGLLNSALHATYGLKFKAIDRNRRQYHLVGSFDSKDAPALPSYQTGKEIYWEYEKDTRYAVNSEVFQDGGPRPHTFASFDNLVHETWQNVWGNNPWAPGIISTDGTIPLDMSANIMQKTVLNLLTGRWINPNGKLFQKLIREGFIYTDSLSDYIEDIWSRSKFIFSHPALIPPLSIIANRPTIWGSFPISVKSVIKGGISLFTQEKNKRSSLQNLIQMNYSNKNLIILLALCWEREETKAWRNNVLMKFLHHPNLAPSKYRPNSLYDAFTKTNALGPEQILALARALY